MKKLHNKGFTIAELLIASMIFTTILLLCVEGITRIAKVYVKNTSISRANEFGKTLISDISGQIKYGSSLPLYKVTPPEIKLCSAGKAYKIVLNQQTTDSIKRKSDPTCKFYDNDPNFFESGAENLTPSSARVLDFNIVKNDLSSSWYIAIRVAIGDSDLLRKNDGSALPPSPSYDEYKDAQCAGGISGSEFCSVVAISTNVTRRMGLGE